MEVKKEKLLSPTKERNSAKTLKDISIIISLIAVDLIFDINYFIIRIDAEEKIWNQCDKWIRQGHYSIFKNRYKTVSIF